MVREVQQRDMLNLRMFRQVTELMFMWDRITVPIHLTLL